MLVKKNEKLGKNETTAVLETKPEFCSKKACLICSNGYYLVFLPPIVFQTQFFISMRRCLVVAGRTGKGGGK